MKLHILGARGSIAYSSQNTSIYGGNSQCVMLVIDDTAIILDGGSGILSANKIISDNPAIKNIYIIISHYHLDHIVGLIMSPLVLCGKYEVTLYAPKYDKKPPEQILSEIFRPPYWPIDFSKVLDKLKVLPFYENTTFPIQNCKIDTISLNHPNGSIGTKISHNNKSIAYIFDHEHTLDFENTLGEFIKNVDMLMIDCPYTEDEYQSKIGYGHSPLHTIITLADKFLIKNMIISHHATLKTDVDLDIIENTLSKHNKNYRLAKEGMVISL